MSPIHLFLNSPERQDSHDKKPKSAESVGEEVHLTFVNEDDDLVLEKCSKHKRRNWD